MLAPGTLNLAIEIDGQACGSVAAQQGMAERGHTAELGYWLGQAYWGHGVMTRVVGLFAPWVMDELRLFRLQATVVDFNLGSTKQRYRSGLRSGRIDRSLPADGTSLQPADWRERAWKQPYTSSTASSGARH